MALVEVTQAPAPRPAPPVGDRFLTVTQLARDLGITARTIRFYEDKGLLCPQRAGTTRVYTARDRARMILILRGKNLGFSLREIKEYLDLYDVDHTQVEQVKALLGAVHQRLELLREQRKSLEATIDELEDIQRQAQEALEKGPLEIKHAHR
ncbi:MAG TPA: MerR family DNA-binding transcriptional regulator [Acetobacteraceae bacterium]|nr:MerR family DNA-binding transcriptional regulator [Acetobacteraceae bacterium]